MRLRFAGVILLAVLAACSRGAKESAPTPAPTNATGFPLYSQSSILMTREWRQSVTANAAQSAGGVFGQGAGTYSGNELIATSPASIEELEAWLSGMRKTPPSGFTVSPLGNDADARDRVRRMGIDYAAFRYEANGKRRDVAVIAIDPATLDTKAGALISLVSKYKMLPQGLRDPIDAQAKRQTGFTISDALSPQTPFGAAIDAFDRLKTTGERGIVVIDAAKI